MKTILLSLLCGASLMVTAQPIPKRNQAQDARVRQGVRNGSLTPAEAARLDRQQDRIQREIRRDRVDGGGMTATERAEAHQRLNRQSQRIYNQKHDAQQRPR